MYIASWSTLSKLLISIIRLSKQYTFKSLFLVADFDGDNVHCRFASGSDECASICGNHVSFLTLNEVSDFII